MKNSLLSLAAILVLAAAIGCSKAEEPTTTGAATAGAAGTPAQPGAGASAVDSAMAAPPGVKTGTP